MNSAQRNWFLTELRTLATRLEEALAGFDPNSTPSIMAVRMALQTLENSARKVGVNVLADAASRISNAPPESLRESTANLVNLLKEQGRRAEASNPCILVVGAEGTVLAEVAARLAGGGRPIVRAATAQEALVNLGKRDAMLVVTNIVLPDREARKFVIEMRSNPKFAAIPVLVYSARARQQDGTQAPILGESDSLMGPESSADDIVRWIESRLRRNDATVRPALRDPLTGLLNRAAFAEHYQRELTQAKGSGDNSSIAMIRIDSHPEISGRLGPDVGNRLLRHTAGIISKTFRASDIVARWSPVEFMVLMPGEGDAGAARAVDRFREALVADPFVLPDGSKLVVKVTAGASPLLQNVKPPPPVALVQGPADPSAPASSKPAHATAPTAHNAPAAVQASKPAAEARVPAKDDGTREWVIVFTKSETTGRVISMFLEKEGFETEIVSHLHESVTARLNERKCAAMLLDDSTDDDQFALLRRIRAMPRQARTPIVALSSNEAGARQALESGATDHVLKPLDMVALMGAVRRLISKGGGEEGPESLLIVGLDVHGLIILGTAMQKQTGFVVLLAHGAQEGVRLLSKRRPTVVLANIDMRGPDTHQLLEALSVLRPSPAIVLAVDAKDAPYARTIKTPPVRGVLERPLNPLAVARQVQEVCGIVPASAPGLPGTAKVLKEEIDRIMHKA